MSILTVTAKGQVTLRKELLNHLGVEPGDKIEADLLPDGRVTISAAQRKKDSIENLIGYFHDPKGPKLTLEEIEEVIEKGWAGEP
jgi:bifunctional DNA-binding transcriptional regulator/antitoxin component of YhaV-PrlF toxin-antitoxin module